MFENLTKEQLERARRIFYPDEETKRYIDEISESIKSQAEIYKMIVKETNKYTFWYFLTDILGLRNRKSPWFFQEVYIKYLENRDANEIN